MVYSPREKDRATLSRKGTNMNKKDLATLRRRYSPEKNDISIIRGCFVNEKREIVSTGSIPDFV